jgi:hypothetical protein
MWLWLLQLCQLIKFEVSHACASVIAYQPQTAAISFPHAPTFEKGNAVSAEKANRLASGLAFFANSQ